MKNVNWLKKRKIGVLFGGRSSERSISLLSGKAVLAALKRKGFDAVGIDAGNDIARVLKKKRINFAYIVLHGPWGEDGTVQGMLEMMGIPYTGSKVLSSALCMNKVYTKYVLERFGIASAPWIVCRKRSLKTDVSAAVKKFGGRTVVVKPADQGSAYGVSVVRKKSGIASALRKAFAFGPEAIVERYIPGKEVTCGVLGGRALPVVEIVPRNEFYDFESKYKKGMSDHMIPPRIPKAAVKKVKEAAVRSFAALGCRAVARIDIIVDRSGKPWVLEANTIPGMTETSLLPDEARAVGMSFDDLVVKIMQYSV
ncbi:MAG: D-alanine--D-alanine ligase [Endomicrobiales bacterium]|nr:D-alanine--D-alanine ligase [Endomicrobiales bacterium]